MARMNYTFSIQGKPTTNTASPLKGCTAFCMDVLHRLAC